MNDRPQVKYRPDYWQWEFIKNRTKNVALVGEFGSGKTRAAVSKVIACIDELSASRAVVIRNHHEDLRRSTIPQFFEYYCGGEHLLPDDHVLNRTTKHLVFPDRSVVDFIALDRYQDANKLKNEKFSAVFIDQAEEILVEIFQMAVARCREQKDTNMNRVIIAANPEEGAWFNDYFFVDEIEVTHDIMFDVDGNQIKVEHGIWRGIDENFVGIKAKPMANAPNLETGYYDKLQQILPRDQIFRYVFNKAVGRGGLVYSFTDENIVEQEDYFDLIRIPFHWKLFCSQDYGISETNPMVWLWGIMTETGDIHIVSEYYEYTKGIDHVSAYVSNQIQFQFAGRNPEFIVGCPRTFQREGTSNKRPVDLFPLEIRPKEFPIHFDIRQPMVEKLIETRRLKVWRQCPNLIKELQTRKWRNIKTAEDHATEAMERMVAKAKLPQQDPRIPQTEREPRHKPVTAGLLEMQL